MQSIQKESSTSRTGELLNLAAAKAIRYVDQAAERAVAPSSADLATLGKFHEPFPSEPCDPAQVLNQLDAVGSPATTATTGGRYFGFVNGGMVPAALAASWIAAAWNQNAALRVMSPVAAELEDVVLRWICELTQTGWDVTENGMFGAPPIELVVGAEVHASVLKALSMAGFGRKRVTIVEADSQGRMRSNRLPRLTKHTIVCIQAGSVNTGAFDPADQICAAAKEQGAWVHVDGAFGLWARVSPKYAPLAHGFEKADSWATDAHKWPNAGYDCGVVLVRNGDALRASLGIAAAYLEPGARREPMHHTPEASRRARGVELWATLKSLGRAGLCQLIERTCAHAQRFAEGLREAGFEVLNEVVINQVLVSFGTPDVTREVIRGIQEEGTCWCGGTVWQGRVAMRISVSSWATTERDVERSLEAITRIARDSNSVPTSA